MKKLSFILIAFTILFDSCSNCKDISIGNVDVMESSLVLLNNLKGKTLTYKDSLGKNIVFKAESALTKIDNKISNKVLCQEAFNTGFEFFDTKINLLKLSSQELNIGLDLSVFVINKNLDSLTSDTTLLYDIMECKTGNNGLSSIFFQSESSKRGTPKPDILIKPVPIEELTILDKIFKKVIVKSNDLKSKTIEPLELYFNFNQGVIGFRLLDGRMFVLDKIE